MVTATYRKRLKKARKEKRKKTHSQSYLRKKDAFSKFPKIVYSCGNVCPHFAKKVKESVNAFVINHERLLPPAAVEVFHNARRKDFAAAIRRHREARQEGGISSLNQETTEEESELLWKPNDCVLAGLDSSFVDNYLPMSTFEVRPQGPTRNTLLVEMRALNTIKTAGGTGYYSPVGHTVMLGSQRRPVAFSRHAIQRLCERMLGDWKSGVVQNRAFCALRDSLVFRAWRPSPSEVGFAVYFEALYSPEDMERLARIVPSVDPTTKYYFCVGYCPAGEARQFVIAKTLLSPGMRGTPEYRHCVRHWPEAKRDLFRPVTGNLTRDAYVLEYDPNVLKEFHRAGVPQFISAEELQKEQLGVVC